MLITLFKHEWKTASKLLFVVHGFALLFAIFSRITLEVIGGIESESIIVGLLIFAMLMIIGSAALFTSIYIGFRFYKHVFTDQGYLTNTLPVTPVQIIWSKTFVGILWIILDILIIILCCIVLFANGSFFSGLGEFFRELQIVIAQGSKTLAFWMGLLCVILSPLAVTAQLYFCVAVGNLFSGHKLLGAVGVFVGTYTVQQIIGTVILMATGRNLFTSNYHSNSGLSVTADNLMTPLNSMMVTTAIFSIICIVGFYLVTNYIMTRKLNLQ